MSLLVTRGLAKRYGGALVVDHLDLTIERGELYGFLGPNGAGKSTTIRMILGLVFPDDGSAEVAGHPVFGSSASRRDALRRTGALVEEPAFWGYLSGPRNLEYFARAGGPRADVERRLATIDEVLRTVGLGDTGSKKVKAYSHGMRQRLGVAQALMGAPELVVLDEPTNGLDPQGMKDMRALLRRLADEGTTVFVSSHLLGEVEAMCDRVGVLVEGRLVAEGPPARLLEVPDRLMIEVDDRGRALEVLGTFAGVSVGPGRDGPIRVGLTDGATPAEVNAALVGAGVGVNALVRERERLEDFFLAVTKESG